MIDFTPKQETIIKRIRGNKTIISDELDSVSSLTQIYQEISFDSTGNIVDKKNDVHLQVINAPQTAEEIAKVVELRDFKGIKLVNPITINPDSTLGELSYLVKVLINSIVMHDIQQQAKQNVLTA